MITKVKLKINLEGSIKQEILSTQMCIYLPIFGCKVTICFILGFFFL